MNKKKLLLIFMLIISHLALGALAWRGGGEFAIDKLTRELTNELATNGRLEPCFAALLREQQEIAP